MAKNESKTSSDRNNMVSLNVVRNQTSYCTKCSTEVTIYDSQIIGTSQGGLGRGKHLVIRFLQMMQIETGITHNGINLFVCQGKLRRDMRYSKFTSYFLSCDGNGRNTHFHRPIGRRSTV